jgi:hypothetical protein
MSTDVSEEHHAIFFLLDLFFDPEDGGGMFLRFRLPFNGLHGVTAKKRKLFKNAFMFIPQSLV